MLRDAALGCLVLVSAGAVACEWEGKRPTTGELVAEADGVFVARVTKLVEEPAAEHRFAKPGDLVYHFDLLDVWKGDAPRSNRLLSLWTSCGIPLWPGRIYMFLVPSGVDTSEPFWVGEGTMQLEPLTQSQLDYYRFELRAYLPEKASPR